MWAASLCVLLVVASTPGPWPRRAAGSCPSSVNPPLHASASPQGTLSHRENRAPRNFSHHYVPRTPSHLAGSKGSAGDCWFLLGGGQLTPRGSSGCEAGQACVVEALVSELTVGEVLPDTPQAVFQEVGGQLWAGSPQEVLFTSLRKVGRPSPPGTCGRGRRARKPGGLPRASVGLCCVVPGKTGLDEGLTARKVPAFDQRGAGLRGSPGQTWFGPRCACQTQIKH